MRSVVTVQLPVPLGAAPQQIELQDGDSATFGECRCGHCDLDLSLDGGPCFAAEITAAGQYGLLSNLTVRGALLVENLENSYEYFTVDPGRHLMPVPFELSRIGAAAGPGDARVTVFGPEPERGSARLHSCPGALVDLVLDPQATYFAVLQALCQPRLSGRLTTPLPTSEEVANTVGLTSRAVDAHIEYLMGKLGLARGAGRDVLVATVIRRRLIPV
jgi:hypothetical protein